MTNRLTPNAKTLLAAAVAASALMGLSACGSSSDKTAAAAAVTSATNTAAVSAPSTTQQSPAPGGGSSSQPGAADASQPPTGDPAQDSADKPQPPAQTQTHAPASKPTTAKAANPDPALPGACATNHLKGTVTGLTRPINHVLLTVTNTGSTTCDLYYYPDLRLDADQQSVTQALEDSKPQAVVTIAPGDSAYAAIGTSAADGSGGTPKLEKQVEVFLESRDQSGSLPGSLTLPLPAGTYVDDKAFVTYWQSDLQSATAW